MTRHRGEVKERIQILVSEALNAWQHWPRNSAMEASNAAEADGIRITNAILALLSRQQSSGPLDAVLREAVRWANEMFGAGPGREAAKAKHLLKEAHELIADPTNPAEMADILILLGHLADSAGVDLAAAVRQKLAELRTREWSEPDADGVVEHLRQPVNTSAEPVQAPPKNAQVDDIAEVRYTADRMISCAEATLVAVDLRAEDIEKALSAALRDAEYVCLGENDSDAIRRGVESLHTLLARCKAAEARVTQLDREVNVAYRNASAVLRTSMQRTQRINELETALRRFTALRTDTPTFVYAFAIAVMGANDALNDTKRDPAAQSIDFDRDGQ
jgi:hypothetical protein